MGISHRGSSTGSLYSSYPEQASQDDLFSLYKISPIGQTSREYPQTIQMELQNEGLAPEDIKDEEEALKEVSEDEVRQQIMSEFGLDELEHADIIDKAVERELSHLKTKASLTRQKANWRSKALDKDKKPPETTKSINPDEIESKARQAAREELENEFLDSMDVPDDLKTEIKKLAKLEGIPVRKAATDPYILHKREKYEQEKKVQEAAISRNNKTAAQTSFDPDKPPKLDPNIDVNTPEGKAALAKYQKDMSEWIEKAKKQ